MKPLAIIPTYVREAMDLAVFRRTLETLRETASDRCDVFVIDDGSPERELAASIADICEEFGAEWALKDENEGFASTVNVGLRRCLEEGRDAVLVNADVEFGLTQDWLGMMERQERMQAAPGEEPGLASMVGALLLYPNGLIQHGGIYFSLLTRDFGHRFNYGPGNLPEAQHAAVCPVTGALQFIRHECLEGVGLYDEGFRLGWEDVDYCVRVWLSGRQSIYQPGIRAIHYESFFRSRANEKIAKWTQESWLRFCSKYAQVNFVEFVPTMGMLVRAG